MLTRLYLIVFFAALSLLFLHPVNSGDFFHHIATGRDIVQTGTLPRTDSWTFTAVGKPWVAHSWGSGVLYYLIYSLAGYHGISVFFAIIGVATTWILYTSTRTLLVAFLSAALISLRWPSRPEVMAPFFTALLFFFLPTLTHPKKSYIIILIVWLWSVLYGSSVFFAILILFLYILTRKLFTKQSAIIVTLSVAAAMANGYGFKSFLYVFSIPKIAGHVGEWLPVTKALDPSSPGVVLFYQYPVLVYGLFTIFLAMAFTWAILRNRTSLTQNMFFSVISAAVVMPFISVRFLNLAPVLVAPILGILISGLSQRTHRVLVIVCLTIGMSATMTRIYLFPVKTGLETHPFGSSAFSFLDAHNISGNIYTDQELGAYVRWVRPNAKIFVDTRDDLFIPTPIFSDLANLKNGKTNITTILNTYKADIIIGDVANQIYTPLFYLTTWKLVHVGESMFVAMRTELAQRYALSSYDALDPTRVPPAKPGLLTEALADIERVISQDDSLENQVRKAELLLAAGRTDEAYAVAEAIDAPDFYGAARPIVYQGLWELKAKFAFAANQCTSMKTALLHVEAYSNRPFLFSPRKNLLSGANYYWGHYYISCERDISKARQYLRRYAAQTPNSRERRDIENLLESLVE